MLLFIGICGIILMGRYFMKFKDKTDLESIRRIAHLFNEFNIEVGDYAIINHPFIDSPIYPKQSKSGEIIFLDTSKEKDLKIIKKEISKQIDKISSYWQFQLIMNKRYASAFFKYTYEFLCKEDFKSALLNLFTRLEYPNVDKNFTPRQFIRLFKSVPTKEWIDTDDLKHYDELPEVVTVYRGVKPKGKIQALSWTDNKDTAQWFADRFEKNGTVYKAEINKEDILVYTNQRDEHECIIDFTKLRNIEEVK
jgi:hypothetical protein